MSTPNGPQGEVKSTAVVQVIAAAILMATVIYAVVGTLFVQVIMAEEDESPFMPGETSALLEKVLLVVGALIALASFPVRKAIEARLLQDEGSLADKLRVVIISMAVAESASVIGLVCAILTLRLTIPFILWGCGLAASVFHFPTRAWLESSTT